MILKRSVAFLAAVELPGRGRQPGGTPTAATTKTTTKATTSTSAAVTGTFTNPIIWEDLADLDIFRVDDVWYYTASTMHYSPGAPILRSYDLVNWVYIGHAVPKLSWSTAYDLAGTSRAYDAYPGGRIPVLAPVTWGADGFPALAISNGVWGSAYAMPAARHALPALTGTDTFSGTALGAAWEWNHNPDTGKFVVDDGLTLAAATVTTAATGSYAASVPVAAANARKIYLRGTVDIRPGTGRTGSFSYSLDGTRFTPLGSGVVLNSDWRFFMGYRWGIFNLDIFLSYRFGHANKPHKFCPTCGTSILIGFSESDREIERQVAAVNIRAFVGIEKLVKGLDLKHVDGKRKLGPTYTTPRFKNGKSDETSAKDLVSGITPDTI
ncbi:hypothetical protein F5B18DRAFT_650649 [Nemania serpens]|nr:hypothetical protein F5B18DRAFT_650649 [Nemania serpens]